MLLKPYIGKVNINSLSSESGNPHEKTYSCYEQDESNQFLESEGRLMMLTTLYHERSLRKNKLIHDVYGVFECVHTWPACKCNFAKTIRGYDMGLAIDRIDYLREIL